MKNYYDLFVALSQMQCLKDDYDNKRRVFKNNAAHRKMAALQKEMRKQNQKETALSLLRHPDERVKLNAASLCLTMNTHISDAINVLREIQEHSADPTLRMTAKMLTIQETQER